MKIKQIFIVMILYLTQSMLEAGEIIYYDINGNAITETEYRQIIKNQYNPEARIIKNKELLKSVNHRDYFRGVEIEAQTLSPKMDKPDLKDQQSDIKQDSDTALINIPPKDAETGNIPPKVESTPHRDTDDMTPSKTYPPKAWEMGEGWQKPSRIIEKEVSLPGGGKMNIKKYEYDESVQKSD